MKRYLVCCWLLVSFYFITPLALYPQPSDNYLINTLDVLVQRTLQAYNHQDYAMFYKYFAKQMAPIQAKRFFDAEYMSVYKKQLGAVLEKRLLREKSRLNHDLPELVYQAKFENFNPVLITVNFVNQHDDYRITRIRFDRVYANEQEGTDTP